MPFFHLSGAILENGSVISPGNWGRIIRQLGWQHGRSVFEVALDDQRLRNFADLPSRLEASFFFDDVGEARFYRNVQNLHTHVLYEVDLLNPAATQHRTDWRNISPKDPWTTTGLAAIGRRFFSRHTKAVTFVGRSSQQVL